MQTTKRDQFREVSYYSLVNWTIEKDILLQWTLDINGMENFVYMNWVNVKNQNSFCFVVFSPATLNETLTANAGPKFKIYTPKRDDDHPRPFHMGVPHPRELSQK